MILTATLAFGCGRSSSDEAAEGGAGGTAGGGGGGTSGGGTGTGGSGGTAGGLPACEPFEPCGGDVVGSWAVVSACVGELGDFGASCENAVTDVSFSATGTLTFTESEIISDITANAALDVSIDDACATAFGFPEGQLALVCLALGQDGSCALAGAACDCSFDLVVAEPAEPVGYTISGNEIIEDGGEARAYCVTGDRLALENVEPTTGVTNVIELERR